MAAPVSSTAPVVDSQSPHVRPRIIVVMPAYNAELTLERTWQEIPHELVDEIVLVDDGSRDRTVEIARRLGIVVIEHPHNRGYGGNQKTCYREALSRGADVIAMLHPDYQYDSRVLRFLIGLIELGICDVVLGSRIRSRQEALSGGMPFWKYFSNRVLTVIENVVLGQNLGDFHSGMRAYSRRVLETLPFEINSDDFVFDTQFLVQAAYFGFRIGDVPVPARYFAEASSINFRRSVVYGVSTLMALTRYVLHRARLIKSPLFKSQRRPGAAPES